MREKERGGERERGREGERGGERERERERGGETFINQWGFLAYYYDHAESECGMGGGGWEFRRES